MEREFWIHRLIREENSSSGLPPSFNESLELEEATEQFLQDLKAHFIQAAKVFNHFKKSGPSLYIYKINNMKGGFMSYRTGFRLLFYSEGPGKIRVRMLKTSYGREEKELLNTYIQAFRSSPLSAFKWNHENHTGFVEVQMLVSYYFQLFIRKSRSDRLKKSERLLENQDNRSFL